MEVGTLHRGNDCAKGRTTRNCQEGLHSYISQCILGLAELGTIRTPRKVGLHCDTVFGHRLQKRICITIVVVDAVSVVDGLFNREDVLVLDWIPVLCHAELEGTINITSRETVQKGKDTNYMGFWYVYDLLLSVNHNEGVGMRRTCHK